MEEIIKEQGNFIEEFVKADLSEGVYNSVQTRFRLNRTDTFTSVMQRLFA